MQAIQVEGVSKTFGDRTVVRDLSFEVEQGEVFGLVGPNGAGKTTTIRMLLDIIRPDQGSLRLLGQAMGEELKARIGYLPEERGLYRGLKVIETLRYLANLKGMDSGTAESRAAILLDRLGMLAHKEKKVSELSRGMGQLIQFAATILHEPELVILDEPFAGLDPVNVRLLKDLLMKLSREGATVVFSTHQMDQVEELCDRVLMINHGRAVLYGRLRDIKRRFRSNAVFLAASSYPDGLKGVASWRDHGTYWELLLKDGSRPQEVLERLLALGVEVDRFEVATPSLEEIFVQVAGEEP